MGIALNKAQFLAGRVKPLANQLFSNLIVLFFPSLTVSPIGRT
jgi:hypothetical protein